MTRYLEQTYPKLKDKWVRVLKQELIKTRMVSKATLKDIGVVFDDYIGRTNYALSKLTNLYNKHGGEYCTLLELLNAINSEGRFNEVYKVRGV